MTNKWKLKIILFNIYVGNIVRIKKTTDNVKKNVDYTYPISDLTLK